MRQERVSHLARHRRATVGPRISADGAHIGPVGGHADHAHFWSAAAANSTVEWFADASGQFGS
jgi:hypothetical protein